jgi:hypothetical protein
MRQVPAPTSTGWLLDLAAVRGPRFVVLHADEAAARQALAAHLVDSGVLAGEAEADLLVAEADIEPVDVIW